MVRKRTALICWTLLAVFAAVPSQARLWKDVRIQLTGGPMFQSGPAPSLALLYGVQPVISNYYIGGRSPFMVVHQTAFGWENYAMPQGYICGDGAGEIVSYQTPVNYGQDGKFYSYAVNPMRPVSLDDGDGPAWTGPSGPYACVSADAAGAIYMACGNAVGRSVGPGWSPLVQLSGVSAALDLAVSPFGDIAVAGGGSSGALTVHWFDYKAASWLSRTLTPQARGNADIAWDSKGNLGVAYVIGTSVMFDYLDIGTRSWTSEIVNSQPSNYFAGAALAFDRFGDPVIASGDYLFYDPPARGFVPEPSSAIAILTYLGGIGCLVRWRRK